MQQTRSQSGFSLIELMVAMAIMLLISGAAVGALLRMTSAQATIWNRTQMHSGIRGATEVLQQEVGQAGRISLPVVVTLTNGTTGCGPTVNCTTTITVSSVNGMFLDEKIVIDLGDKQETVLITNIDTSTRILTVKSATGDVVGPHTTTGVPVQALGAFSAGIIPPLASPSTYVPSGPTMTYTDGSTGNVLKMFGDINADGNMVYVEYECIIPASPSTAPGNLYRRVMPWNQTTPTTRPPSASDILLSNIMRNPDSTPCFTYQVQPVNMNGVVTYFVTDVAITLTVQTQNRDPVTKQFQNETKALLNVSPRNVFNAWQLAALKVYERVQPIPASVTALLH